MLPRVRVIDSHTGGEPTRVVIEGGPDLGTASLSEQRDLFRESHDAFRSAIVNEPRGSEEVVGAVLCHSPRPDCDFGTIFFNNVGYLGMCVHGTIGLVVTLAHLGRIELGEVSIDTPVGVVSARLHDDGEVTVRNVSSYRFRESVPLEVPGLGTVHGDVAWGGNWFFLVDDHGLEITFARRHELIDAAWKIRLALEEQGITGQDSGEIDHIELFGPAEPKVADSRNFVLCPGRAYDRSPCGTGTSAKLACLYAAGRLNPGEVWRQESIVGSVFRGHIEIDPPEPDPTATPPDPNPTRVVPYVQGSAYITADAALLLDPNDPFVDGIRG